ncbi:MAG TPA: hypothetical protein VIE89_33300 [Candidatus Binatia bacterium]
MATTDDLSDGTKDAGSAIIAQSFGIGTADCSSFAGFLDSTGFLVMVHVLKPVTATGVMFVQTQQAVTRRTITTASAYTVLVHRP